MMKVLGSKIQKARLSQNISLNELYNRTRIDIKILEKIEKGEDPGLPSAHLKAFLRTICSELSIDPGTLIDESVRDESVLNQPDLDREKEIKTRFMSFLTYPSLIGLTGSAAVLIIILWLSGFGRHSTGFYENLTESMQDSVDTNPFALLADTTVYFSLKADNSAKNSNKNKIKSDSAKSIQKNRKDLITGTITWEDLSGLIKDLPESAKYTEVDSATIAMLEQLNPKMSIVLFIGTWNPVSVVTGLKISTIFRQAYTPGVKVSIVGVDKALHDPGGLADLHRIKNVPEIIFISMGRELCRITSIVSFADIPYIETRLINIAKKSEAYVKAETDE